MSAALSAQSEPITQQRPSQAMWRMVANQASPESQVDAT
jgi:hypothetical protein